MLWSIIYHVQWDDGACNKRKRGPPTKEKKEKKKVLVFPSIAFHSYIVQLGLLMLLSHCKLFRKVSYCDILWNSS